ncbi:Receptor-like protein kinase [Melia azedarach]|uniref:Receptor-like protein kinase n=1 Tax=Melia azedarach TaxID=155640 RepID=A0ACC1XF91_MELAZ|nr:Receptor-like protein kinase [Melia azedarach]
MDSSSYLVLFFISLRILLSLAERETRFNPRCPYFPCGKLGQVGFPFSNQTHPECGLMIIDNCDKPVQRIQLGKEGPRYNITNIYKDNTIAVEDRVFQHQLQNRSCESFRNSIFPSSPLLSFDIKSNLTLFKCPTNLDNKPTNFSLNCRDSFIYYNHPDADLPSVFLLRVHIPLWRECFNCQEREGECRSDSKGNFYCSKAKTGEEQLRLKLGLGLGASSSVICILIILAFCFMKRLSLDNSIIFWKRKTKTYGVIEDFLRNYGSLAPKRYSYSDIKKMTNSFNHKLGQGGYGVVYKGQLHNARDVAVKVLNESKGNGEEFINEVASTSKTSHVNIVTLLGFCFDGHRRALIYEFVPNGSLEKFIYDKHSNHKLNWKTLYQIAVGIARGLEYLHRGCSTRILHLDIKPHNILLDEDFCPKISDFGLAKIYPRKESIVLVTGARGTAGYIAPEVFCRNFGEVSHKSDVYSYGMMVFEMTGRKNNNVGNNRSSDVYFPDWVCKCLETDEELALQGIENGEDKEYARKMIIVSLWCIQTIPSNRPTISSVVEMLEGSLESLQIPPRPYLSSPAISQADSSSSTQRTLTL